MGKRDKILGMFHGNGVMSDSSEVVVSREQELSRGTSLVIPEEETVKGNIRVKLKHRIYGRDGLQILAQTEKKVDGKKVTVLQDNFDDLDKTLVPYVGRYCTMKNGLFQHFITLEEALEQSHQKINSGERRFGYADGAMIFGPYPLEKIIVTMQIFFVGQKSYITNSSWLASQLSGNMVFQKDFVFIDGKIDHLATREDYGDGDEEIVSEPYEDEEEEETAEEEEA